MRIKVPEGKKKMEEKKRSEYDRRNRIQRIILQWVEEGV